MAMPRRLHFGTSNLVRLGVAGLIVAAVCAVVAPAFSQGLQPMVLVPPGADAGFPRVFFGMHLHNNPGQPPRWPTVPIGSLRLWDARVSWPWLEPERGHWQFDRLDKYLEWAEGRSVEVVLPLGLSPRWASARPDEASAYGAGGIGYAAEPASLDDWRRYVRTVAQRYKGRIRYYELWNEVSDPAFYSGSLDELANLARAAKAELKAVDPKILFIGPSAVDLNDRKTAMPAEFVAKAGPGVVDIVSYHLYHGGQLPEAMVVAAPNVRRELDRRGLTGLPVWNTEAGYYITPPADLAARGQAFRRYYISADTAAQYLPRDLLLARAMGYERYFFYSWDNDFLGFVEPGTDILRPHARVLQQFIELLVDSRLSGCDRDAQGLWRCMLRLKGGAEALALWRDPAAKAEALSVPLPWPGHLVLLDGQATDRQPARGNITPGPVVQVLIRDAR